MHCRSKIQALLLAILTLVSSYSFAATRNNITCGIENGQPLSNAYGPWDYTKASHQDKLPIVLKVHFDRDVAKLNKGMTGRLPHGDIDYTLRAIPNYHPALFSMSKLERRDKATLLPGETYKPKYYSAECYFTRALYLQPKDHLARMLFAMHWQQNKQYKRAEMHYLLALDLKPNDPELNYNIGLLYANMKEIEKASKHANVAYTAGHPLPGLRNKIAQLKKEQLKKAPNN